MMRSMYSGVSGLRTHQLKMDVIGNNIANVNTVGFKRSQASFQEIFSQTTAGASAPQGGRGGTNPQQVGLGVSMGSIRVNHDPGSAQRTDNPLDFFIGGDGYFVVSGDSNFNNRSYTRAGNFDLDRNGTLVTGEGLKVLGYKVEGDTVSDELSEIVIDKSNTVGATTTKNMELKGNLDSRAKGGIKVTTDTVIYDSLGNPYNVKYEFEKLEADTDTDIDENTWSAKIVSMKDSDGGVNLINGDEIDLGTIEFDTDGKILQDGVTAGTTDTTDTTDTTGTTVTTGSAEVVDGKHAVTIGLTWGGTGGTDGKSNFGEGDAGTITIDFSGLTQYGNDSTVKASAPDGNTSGNIESFSVSKSGEIVAVYTNGENKVLSQIALAKFDNPGGLIKEGSNLFKDTRNSGEAQYGTAGGSGYGQMLGGAVEMSNVDLSNEFTDMITTQRGFQANSRIITTSDEMLQELMSLKR